MRSNKAQTVLGFMFLLVSISVNADVPPSQKHEIDYLLLFVKQSSCLLERNGTKYSGEAAVAHIEKKYAYFRNKITTTEEFVEYSASKSTVSGKRYQVYCPNSDPIKTQDWLLDALSRYRAR